MSSEGFAAHIHVAMWTILIFWFVSLYGTPSLLSCNVISFLFIAAYSDIIRLTLETTTTYSYSYTTFIDDAELRHEFECGIYT